MKSTPRLSASCEYKSPARLGDVLDIHEVDLPCSGPGLKPGAVRGRPSGTKRIHLSDDWPPLGRGVPIGAYTSQLFAAHVYLNRFDHFVKRELKVPGYLRYVDDLFCFGDRRADLRRWRWEIAGWLREERELRLKHPNARILPCRGHLDALGYRVTRTGLRVLPRALRRIEGRAAAAVTRPGSVDFGRSVAASAGVVLF